MNELRSPCPLVVNKESHLIVLHFHDEQNGLIEKIRNMAMPLKKHFYSTVSYCMNQKF